MILKDQLMDAIKQHHKAESRLNGLKHEIEERANKDIFYKFLDSRVTKAGMYYSLLAVRCSLNVCKKTLAPKIYVRLYFYAENGCINDKKIKRKLYEAKRKQKESGKFKSLRLNETDLIFDKEYIIGINSLEYSFYEFSIFNNFSNK